MERDLKIIQALAKAGRIISKILFVCCIIGIIGCLIGLVVVGATGIMTSIKVEGVTLGAHIEAETGITVGNMIAFIICGTVALILEAYLTKAATAYFDNELKAGTPFTLNGAAEMKKLGIKVVIVSLISSALCSGVITASNVAKVKQYAGSANGYSGIGIGIAFIILAVILRYGANLAGNKDK